MLSSKNFNAASIMSLVLSIALFFMWVYADNNQPITSTGVAVVCTFLFLAIVLGFIGHVLERVERRRQAMEASMDNHMTKVKFHDEEFKKTCTRVNHAGEFWNHAFRTHADASYRESIQQRYPRP